MIYIEQKIVKTVNSNNIFIIYKLKKIFVLKIYYFKEKKLRVKRSYTSNGQRK